MLENLIPQQFYMTDLGKIAYLALYLPLVLGLAWWFYRKVKSTWPLLAVMTLVLLTLPFWDVYIIARDAERVCREQGGLHVYKTVEANGFLGGAAERWLKYGFKYVEGGGGNTMSRYTMTEGKVVHRRIQEFISRYGSRTGDNHKIVTNNISRSSEQVVDLKTNEILGELVMFNIYPGNFDGIFLKLAGSGPVIWHCGNEAPEDKKDGLGYGDVVKAVIKPKPFEGDLQ